MRKTLINLHIVLFICQVLAAEDHLIGLTVKQAYGDAASTSNCFTQSPYFPASAIGDTISDEAKLLNTEKFSLDHRIVGFTECVDALNADQLEGVQFELAVTNATTGDQSKKLKLEMIGSDKGVCTRYDVEGYIRELHLGYYSGKIQRISFATSGNQVFVTGPADSRQIA